MKLVAVTACPTGLVHTHPAAEKLEKAAKKHGRSIEVETQGAAGVENELSQAALDVLVQDLQQVHRGRLSTGIFGTKYMLAELMESGRAGVAFGIVNQRTFPGWGCMLKNGATTFWEHLALAGSLISAHAWRSNLSQYPFQRIQFHISDSMGIITKFIESDHAIKCRGLTFRGE